MHPEFLDILRDFRRKNPTIWLYIHTNGGVHDKDYWAEIAAIMNGYGHIAFGIDGLEDTLHIYRRNVSYQKVIANAQAFINAGGKAQWNFIVFKHNEHQVEQAREVSRVMGFTDILVRKTGRFFNQATMQELDRWPVQDRKGNVEYYLELPTQAEYRNKSMLFLPNLKKEYANIKDYFDTTEIKCDALLGKKVLINAEGVVLPCTFLNHKYDARYHSANQLPGVNSLSMLNGRSTIDHFLEQFGIDNLNIQHRTLQEVFDNSMWTALINSFSKTLDNGRLFECANTCGSKLTKVWDQGGSSR
jgi:MoaA/NifB/PqqE/SkfB family radical SAM enzyme